MIPLVSRRSTENRQNPHRQSCSVGVLRVLRCTVILCCTIASPSAHDVEKTQVRIVFERDGRFIVEVANDPSWLKLRLESFPGPFADRVVLWVDGREIRPESDEFIPIDAPGMPGTSPAIRVARD